MNIPYENINILFTNFLNILSVLGLFISFIATLAVIESTKVLVAPLLTIAIIFIIFILIIQLIGYISAFIKSVIVNFNDAKKYGITKYFLFSIFTSFKGYNYVFGLKQI
jgi:hypothetical protein